MGCHLINVTLLPDQELCSIDQTIACLHFPALPWDAAAWNMDGGQEVFFYCRCSLTSPHFAHIFCCLWLVKLIQLRNQQQGFFCCVCLFVFVFKLSAQNCCSQKGNNARSWPKNTGKHGSPSIICSGVEQSQIMSVCDEYFVKEILPLLFLFM